MGRPINPRCVECSKVAYKKHDIRPECYRGKSCMKKRAYYRKLDHYRAELIKRHRYLKYKGDKCAICGESDTLEVHHVMPQSKEGIDSKHNLLTLCHHCHRIISNYYKMVGWVN